MIPKNCLMFIILLLCFLQKTQSHRPSLRSIGFVSPPLNKHRTKNIINNLSLLQPANPSSQKTNNQLYQSNDNNKNEYTQELRLRVEAESPFLKVRYLFYISLIGGAFTSLFVSGTRILAALNGVNVDLMEQSQTNAIVDLVGIVVLGTLWKRDVDAENAKLERASRGAELARLLIRGSGDLLLPMDEGRKGRTVTVPLSSFRRGRGVEKRVVIAVAGKDRIADIIENDVRNMAGSLIMSDLVVVPVLYPSCAAPAFTFHEQNEAGDLDQVIALPSSSVGRQDWNNVIQDEAQKAIEQGVNVEEDGICLVLKKNGRVGQRTKGIYLGRMCGEVEERVDLGLDVKNI